MTGVHLALSANPQSFRTGARGCCTIEDSRDARRAADVIGIPFYVWDLADRFREDVVEDFVAEYEAGRTPNPCLRCNEKIKFAALLDKALALGFDAVCTGHYAKVVTLADGTRELHRASDMAKDQSYVLGVLDDRQLAHALFPRRHGHHEGRDPRGGRAPGPGGGQEARSHTSASSPTATPRASWRSGSAGPRATSSTSPATASARTRARTASPSASARACASAPRPPTASRATSSTSPRWTTRSRSARPPRWTSAP
ncbi:tRNA-specific 2-thiouridylase MnmA [Streptomyces purpurascens]